MDGRGEPRRVLTRSTPQGDFREPVLAAVSFGKTNDPFVVGNEGTGLLDRCCY